MALGTALLKGYFHDEFLQVSRQLADTFVSGIPKPIHGPTCYFTDGIDRINTIDGEVSVG